MKVKFKIENIVKHKEKGLSPNESKYYSKWQIIPESFHLKYGKKYNVYGIEYDENGYVNFLINDDTGVIYPKLYPSEFFDIIDNRLSKYFIGTTNITFPIQDIKPPTFISYKEIVQNGFYYDDFIECKNQANEIFANYKGLMDLEFYDGNFIQSKQLDDNWFQCPNCDFVWEVEEKEPEVICCPNCDTLQNRVNPPDDADL